MTRKSTKFGIAIALLITASTFTSCKKDDPTNEEAQYDAKMQTITDQYVTNTVIATYTNLANYSQDLVDALVKLKENKTDANVQNACSIFLNAREWWEKSEAFLFGAASDFGIDPHIDSWPLDEDAFHSLMNSPEMLSALDAEDGDIVAGERLGATLLGFHGIEYILFENGGAKSAEKISENDLIYAVAVAGDLRNCCFQLEVSWAGDKAAKEHVDLIEELEFNHTVGSGDKSYGENMQQAGKAGSTYASLSQAMMAIVDGCKTIADEVGTSKIGKAYTGEDKDYIESPYSQTSIIDFTNNIYSIYNAYMGGIEGKRDQSASLYSLMDELNKDLNQKVLKTIEDTINTVKAMKAPFVQNYTDESAKAAMDACRAIDDIMNEVYELLKTI